MSVVLFDAWIAVAVVAAAAAGAVALLRIASQPLKELWTTYEREIEAPKKLRLN